MTRGTMQRVLSAVCGLFAYTNTASAQPPLLKTADYPATIEADKITFFLPVPWDPMYPPDTPVTGYFVWRINVDALRPFSIVITSDTALKTNNPDAVYKASTVRLCADPLVVSALECRVRLDAKIDAAPDHFRLIIRDTVLVGRAQRERPAYYWRYIMEAGGRYHLSQREFTYPVAKRR